MTIRELRDLLNSIEDDGLNLDEDITMQVYNFSIGGVWVDEEIKFNLSDRLKLEINIPSLEDSETLSIVNDNNVVFNSEGNEIE